MNDGVGARQKTQVGTPAELAAAREARGMSQLDISQRIKLQVRQVNALEEGQWDALPGKSFVRGALRSYGKLLDVDVAPLLESIGGFAEPAQVQGMQPLDTPLTRSSSGMGFNGGGRGSPILWVIAGLIGVVALVLYFGSDQDSSRIRSWLPSSQTPPGSTTEPTPADTPAEGTPAPAGGDGTSSTSPTLPGGTPQLASGRPAGDAAGTPARHAAGPSAEAGAANAQPAWAALQDLPQVSPTSTASPSPASSDASPSGANAATSAAGALPSTAGSASFGGRGADAITPAVAIPGAAGGATQVGMGAGTNTGLSAGLQAGPNGGLNGGLSGGLNAGQPPSTIAANSPSPVAAVSGEGAAAGTADAAGSAGLVRIKAQEDSWVDVRQADGGSLHNGLVKAGASIEVKGTPPYRVVLGNASHVELSYEGKVQDLKAHTRANNIARLQLR